MYSWKPQTAENNPYFQINLDQSEAGMKDILLR